MFSIKVLGILIIASRFDDWTILIENNYLCYACLLLINIVELVEDAELVDAANYHWEFYYLSLIGTIWSTCPHIPFQL